MPALRSLLYIFFLAAAVLSAPHALAGEDIVRTNGAVNTSAGGEYGRLSTTNGSIRLADGITAGQASTVNGSISAADHVTAVGLETVNGSIRVGERARIAGGVETVNGSIFVGRGSRVGSVDTVNGAIGLVATEVAGDVGIANGDLTIGVGSHVRGKLHVHKPSASWMPVRVSMRKQRVIIGPGAVVDGPLVFEREVLLYVHDTARIGEVSGATPVAYSTPTAPPRAED